MPPHARRRRRASRLILRIVRSRIASRLSPPSVMCARKLASRRASTACRPRSPSLHPTPGVLHCSCLTSLPAAPW
ncbi:hypothetical protein AHAS_Ahas17G0108300 [Arachis hypogaea]